MESICRSKDAIGIVKDVEALRKIDPLNGKITPSDFKKFLGQLNDEIYTSFIKYFFDKRDDVDEVRVNIAHEFWHFACRFRLKKKSMEPTSLLAQPAKQGSY